MSDGYEDPTPHDDHGHYEDSSHDEHEHDHLHSTTTLDYDHERDSYDHDRDGYDHDRDGYVDDDGRHVVVVEETVEVHDLQTVETEHDGRLELVEYDSVHVEHVEQVLVVDDDGRVLEVDGGHEGHLEGDNDFDGRGHVVSLDDQSGHDGTAHAGGHYDSPDANPYAKN
jgi:hypothetical protein